jgi:hypothetical protein
MLLGPQVLHYPPVLIQEGCPCPRYRTFLITPLSSSRKGVLVRDIGRSSSPPVLIQEGCPCPRYRTFLITPPVLIQEGCPCPRYRTFLITPCPHPGRVSLSEISDVPHHPPVLIQEGCPCSRSDIFHTGFLPMMICHRGCASHCDFLPRLCSSL